MARSEVLVEAVTDWASYSAWTFIDGIDGPVYLDTRLFELLWYCKDEHFIFDVQMYVEQLTGVEGWVKRWKHWGGKGLTGSSSVGTRDDSPYLHCVEERGYEMGMFNVLNASCNAEVHLSKL